MKWFLYVCDFKEGTFTIINVYIPGTELRVLISVKIIFVEWFGLLSFKWNSLHEFHFTLPMKMSFAYKNDYEIMRYGNFSNAYRAYDLFSI